MLELRPNCECCNKDLPPDTTDAQRHFIRPLGRVANDGGDSAAIVEQAPLFMGLKRHVGEAGAMQHLPKAIAPT